MQDEIEIEVFRADTKASKGITAAHLADVAAFDCEAHPIGAVLGHPKAEAPAVARIKGFRVDGSALFAKLADVKDDLVNGIKNSSILNRSMAFFGPNEPSNPTPGKLAPRHLGFLGASAPGIPGMKPLTQAFQFSADDELEVIGEPAEAIVFDAPHPTQTLYVFSEEQDVPKPNTPTETADDIAKDREQLDKDRLAFEAEQREARAVVNDGLIDQLVSVGKVTPAEAVDLKLVFSALAPDKLDFAAGEGKVEERTPAAALARIFANCDAIVPLNDQTSPTMQFNAGDGDDAEAIEAKATALMEKTPGLSFEAAVERVSTAK